MIFHNKSVSTGIKIILMSSLFFPFAALAHLISITPVSSFPTSVDVLSSTTATFAVTNLTSRVTLTAIDQSTFPVNSGLSISSTTCGTPIGPGQSCNINLSLQAPASAQTISAELKEWAKPSADGVRFPFTVNVVSSTPPVTPAIFVAVGVSQQTSGINPRPLAYKSVDAGMNWEISSPFPGNEGRLYAASCVNSTCASIGESSGDPIGYTSTDGGSNWVLSSNIQLPVGHTEGILYGIDCVDTQCVATGQSRGEGTGTLPVAYKSNNNGADWILSPEFMMPTDYPEGALKGVSCVGTSCTAVGSAVNGSNDSIPLAYKSVDGGSNWTLSPLFVSGPSNGYLNAVTCVGSTCTAVGSVQSLNLPLAYKSIDGGSNWLVSSGLDLPPGQTDGSLSGVACEANQCIAVGGSNGAGILPLAYTSSDGGTNWTLSSEFTLPNGRLKGLLSGVSCEGAQCTAVGETFNTGNYDSLPLAYTSSDMGAHWTLSSPLLIPDGQDDGSLKGVSSGGLSLQKSGKKIKNPLKIHQ